MIAILTFHNPANVWNLYRKINIPYGMTLEQLKEKYVGNELFLEVMGVGRVYGDRSPHVKDGRSRRCISVRVYETMPELPYNVPKLEPQGIYYERIPNK